jgi:hypothetical protein
MNNNANLGKTCAYLGRYTQARRQCSRQTLTANKETELKNGTTGR